MGDEVSSRRQKDGNPSALELLDRKEPKGAAMVAKNER